MLFKDDLGRLVEKFISEEIALDQDDISSAVKSKEWLLNQIESKIAEKKSDPQLYASDPQIGYGSYFARVKVKDVNEMDFLIVIDSNSGLFKKEAGVQYGSGLGSASPNNKYGPRFMKPDQSGVSPAKLLAWLQGICWEVLQSLGGERPVIDGPAVKVVLKSKGIKFDLIPAGVFERTDGTGTLFYNIPKGDLADGWTLTNPRKDIERVDGLAEKREGFRNIIRLVKLIRDNYQLPVSSYALQCAICQLAEQYQWGDELYSNLRNALIYLEFKLRNGFIEDGFDPVNNLLAGVTNSGHLANTVQEINRRLEALANESDANTAYEKLSQILTGNMSSSKVAPGLKSDWDAITRALHESSGKLVR